MAASLEYVGGKTILLGDGSFRWIRLKRFQLASPDVSVGDEVLDSLLTHPAYRDDLKHFDDGAVSSLKVARDPLHGPYRLDSLSPSSFDEITAERAVQILQQWIEDGRYGWRDGQGKPMTLPHLQNDAVQAIQQHVIQKIVKASRTLYLTTSEPMQSIVGKFGFHEFVLFGPDDAVLLVIAADD